jgi:dTDP-4-dehydrorhamnose 3,5-epimerase
MRFEQTHIPGVVLITPEQIADERGFFARTWGQDVFAAHGLDAPMVQRNVSHNRRAGTVRGMHYQRTPHAEIKLVSCISGRIFDVAIDLRTDSPAFGKWYGAELSESTGAMLYIPEGCGHGYQTLDSDTRVEYLISEYYHPECAAGVRWNDPFFAIHWPLAPTAMNERDRSWPDFAPATSGTKA